MKTPLYHVTSAIKAESIIKSDKFLLRPIELRKGMDGGKAAANRFFFLSLSRQRENYFSRQQATDYYGSKVLFILDRDKLAARYKLVPYKYFSSLSSNEYEERVYADRTFIPAKPFLIGVDILVRGNTPDDIEAGRSQMGGVMPIYKFCKLNKIPVRLYLNNDHWLEGKRDGVDIKRVTELRGKKFTDKRYRPPEIQTAIEYVDAMLTLINTSHPRQIKTKLAKKLFHEFQYDSYKINGVGSNILMYMADLGKADLENRKRLDPLYKFLIKNRLKDIEALFGWLETKCRALAEKEKS